jgi:hypothetical protein
VTVTRSRTPLTPGKRVLLGAAALLMLVIGVLYGATHAAHRFGKVLKVTSDGHGTVSPVGFGYALHAWAKFFFVAVAVGGIGVLLAGAAAQRAAGRWARIGDAALYTGLGMLAAGLGLALLFALASLL